MKRFFLLIFLFSVFLVSCGGNSLKGFWTLSEQNPVEIFEFDGGNVSFYSFACDFPIYLRGKYKISDGEIVLNFTAGFDFETGTWMEFTSEDLEEIGFSNEPIPYNVDGNVLNLGDLDFERMSDEDFAELEKIFDL